MNQLYKHTVAAYGAVMAAFLDKLSMTVVKKSATPFCHGHHLTTLMVSMFLVHSAEVYSNFWTVAF
jgi:hypothetical protein